MASKIFTDTNYFIALYNPTDSQYLKAKNISNKLVDVEIIISNFIFLETVSVFSQRVGRKEAIDLGKHLLEDENIHLVHVDRKLQSSAWEIFCETKKKNTSFVDCSTVVIMKAERINSLLTFDQEDFAPLLKKHHLKLFK